MGPSSTKGATIARLRRPATKVMVFQWPCGTWSINRSPRGQRPRSRTMLVEVAVSSRNTSRAGSNMPCSRIQRRRAWRFFQRHKISASKKSLRAAEQERADVARAKTNLSFNWRLVLAPEFVLRYLVTHEAHRAATAGNPSLVHRRDDFIERQVRLPGNQRK